MESSRFGRVRRFPAAPCGNCTLVLLPDRYRDPQRIGRGGMGEIYHATDELLGRAVAVKVLAERYAEDHGVRERFTREALAAARLSGRPNVVTIFDVGESEGRPFIVMEYLGGGSLEDRVRSGRIPPGQALDWLEQAAVALDAAHAEGVVHRDVKPANLLLDGADNVHVADFGIASAAGMDSLTKTGTVIGTAAYISPEQAQGERATPSSDRYALAVVAWELLTGRRPFGGDTPAAEAAAHVHADVPPIASQHAGLPAKLDAVFARALAKGPAARYASAAEFVADLRDAVHAGSPRTEVLETTATHRPRKKLPVVVALVALLGLGAIVAALIASARNGDGERDAAGQPTTVVRTVTAQGETQRVTVTAAPETQPEPEPEAPSTLSVAQARALQDESTSALANGEWERALSLAQQALAGLRNRDRTYEAYANYNIGRSLAELGRCDEALPYLERREQMLGSHPDVTAAKQMCGA
jgi:eukaryotic-like serine/threonine-protein kinase